MTRRERVAMTLSMAVDGAVLNGPLASADAMSHVASELLAQIHDDLCNFDSVERDVLDFDITAFTMGTDYRARVDRTAVSVAVPVTVEIFDVFEQLDRIPAFIGRMAEQRFAKLAWKLRVA